MGGHGGRAPDGDDHLAIGRGGMQINAPGAGDDVVSIAMASGRTSALSASGARDSADAGHSPTQPLQPLHVAGSMTGVERPPGARRKRIAAWAQMSWQMRQVTPFIARQCAHGTARAACAGAMAGAGRKAPVKKPRLSVLP